MSSNQTVISFLILFSVVPWLGFAFSPILLQPARLSDTTTRSPTIGRGSSCSRTSRSPMLLQMNLFSNLFGGTNQNNKNGSDSDHPNDVPTTIFEIPTLGVKTGALQFLVQIHMVSEGNKPEPKTWFPKQNNAGGLDLYYKDGSGMCTLVISEYSIKAERYGAKPSLQYLLQESVLLHSVLDELEKTAFDVQEVEEDKRLLRLREEDGIEKARTVLPAKAERSS